MKFSLFWAVIWRRGIASLCSLARLTVVHGYEEATPSSGSLMTFLVNPILLSATMAAKQTAGGNRVVCKVILGNGLYPQPAAAQALLSNSHPKRRFPIYKG